MKSAVAAASVVERLSDEIGGGRVIAALFSTFTFRREFFERVPLSLITAEGRRRGFLPITVVLDRTQFEGGGWGYEVVRAPADRRWHAKLLAAMVEDQGAHRTVLAIGSGNLTRSGWERNLELFSVDSWPAWSLPAAVDAWLKTPWLRSSAFARWARESKTGIRRQHHRSVLGNLDEPLWQQLGFVRRGLAWSQLDVVSPFGDTLDDDLDAADACGPFFNQLLEAPRSADARLTVYLRAADQDGTRAYGNRSVLKRLGKHLDLRLRAVPSQGDRILHAKLLAVRSRGSWSVLMGSPNATGAAFVAERGNVELACEFRQAGRSRPTGLLPRSRPIGLDAVSAPKIVEPRPRWECLESATYQPHKKRIILHWKNGHGPFDSRVLFQERDLNPNNVDLASVTDRFLKTLPLGSAKRHFEPDFVPIAVPASEADLVEDERPEGLTADDWLARLDAVAAVPGVSNHTRHTKAATSQERKVEKRAAFAWRARAVMLAERLRGFDAAISDALTTREVDHLRKTVINVWRAHEPRERGITPAERAWRLWVRVGVWQVLSRLDRRISMLRPLSSLATRWSRTVPKRLKDFDIA